MNNFRLTTNDKYNGNLIIPFPLPLWGGVTCLIIYSIYMHLIQITVHLE